MGLRVVSYVTILRCIACNKCMNLSVGAKVSFFTSPTAPSSDITSARPSAAHTTNTTTVQNDPWPLTPLIYSSLVRDGRTILIATKIVPVIGASRSYAAAEPS